MPPTRNEASAPTNPSNQRHRQRVLGALGRLCRTFEALAQRLVFRFRSDEAGDTLDAHRALLEEVKTVGQARDVLGEILEEWIHGTIRPPQLEAQVHSAITSIFAAADPADPSAWPGHLLRAAEVQRLMFDPYGHDSAHIERLPTGTYLITLGQVPTASHSNSEAVSALPATSRRVTRSSSRKVLTSTESQSITT